MNQILKVYNTFTDVSFQVWTYKESEELHFLNGEKHIGVCYIMPKFENLNDYKAYLKNVYKAINFKEYILKKDSLYINDC